MATSAAPCMKSLGSALRSGGGNGYDNAPENIRRNLQANAEPVLAEWDPHPFGVMHEHIPLRAVTGLTVPLTWILGQESSPWLAGLHDRVVRQRPDIRTVRIAGAGHLVHLDRPADFIAAVRSASTPPVSPTTSGLWLSSRSPALARCQGYLVRVRARRPAEAAGACGR